MPYPKRNNSQKPAGSTRTGNHHPTIESRMTRMEDGMQNLTMTVGNFIKKSEENQEHRTKWESAIESRLIQSTRPSWGTFAAIIPIVVIAASWISSYVGSVSSNHTAAEDRIRIESELEIRHATRERSNLEDRITRSEADKARKESYQRAWMDKQIADTAILMERTKNLQAQQP